MPPAFTKVFASSLTSRCKFRVKEAEDGDMLTEGRALLAPGDYHTTITRTGAVKLSESVTMPTLIAVVRSASRLVSVSPVASTSVAAL